ncbi:MAG: marine proteobacterial sortase target protein [Methylophaga sp.]|nr:MAG: marine proteobacterial sortase target protein [Methylophaga sp.]
MPSFIEPSVKNNILMSLGRCVLYSCIIGLVISVGLMSVIMVSASVQAAGVEETKLESIRHINDLASGQLVFRQDDGHYLSSPTLATDVEIKINGLLARVLVSQTFTNPTSLWQEGIYVFPLPETAAVDHLQMKIGERIIIGEIKRKEEAKKIYEAAKASGKRTALLEQQRPNIFTSSVANIAPGDSITITLEYQQMVTQGEDEFSLRFPMVVAPRYIPGKIIAQIEDVKQVNNQGWAMNTDHVPDASAITPPVLVGASDHNLVNLNVTLAAGFPVEKVISRYHEIENIELKNGIRKISLMGDVPARRDFELVWQAKPQFIPQAALFKQHKNNQDYAMVMLMPPKQMNTESIAREMIFIIDTSGSMDGTSMIQARSALLYGLDQLRPQDSFNIIRFSDDLESMFEKSLLATDVNLDIARNFVNWLRATGGTEMAPALKLALSSEQRTNGIRQIVFLTDGSVGNEDELFGIIKQHLGTSRLFTVGIGSAPNSHFMRRAAEYGRGSHSYIGAESEVRQKMQALFTKLAHPVVTNITLELPEGTVLEQWPRIIPDLYLGEPLLVTMRADELPDNIIIKGMLGSTEWQTKVALHSGAASEVVSTFWARRKIEHLMDKYRMNGQLDETKDAIVNVALAHHLVSKFTSLVAVEQTIVRPKEANMKSNAIASNMPAGWKMGQLPQTATLAELQLFFGFFFLLLMQILRWRRV